MKIVRILRGNNPGIPLKFFKYIVIPVAILAIAVVILYLKRDAVAIRVANSILSETKMSVVDVSVTDIGTQSIRLAALELMQDDGLQIRVVGVSLPTNTARLATDTLVIDEIHIDTSIAAGDPASVSSLLRAFLESPTTIPVTNARVGMLTITGMPDVSNLEWRIQDAAPGLTFDTDIFNVAVTIVKNDNADVIETRVISGDSVEALSLSLAIARQDSGYQLSGPGTIRLTPWVPVFHRADILPESVTEMSSILDGNVTVDLPDDAEFAVPAFATLAFVEDVSMEYQITGSKPLHIDIFGGQEIEVMFVYPMLDWTADLSRATLSVSLGDSNQLPIHLTELSCVSGIFCNMHIAMESEPLDFGDAKMSSLFADTSIAVAVTEGAQIEFSPDSRFGIRNLEVSGIVTEKLDASGFGEGFMTFDDDGWRAEFGKFDLMADGIVLSQDMGITITTPVTLMDVAIDNSGGDLSAQLSAGDGLVASFTLRHDAATNTGQLADFEWTADFGDRKLSKYLRKWPFDWDIVRGSWRGAAEANWQLVDDEWRLAGSAKQSLTTLSGKYGDTVFDGLSSTISATVAADGTWQFDPSTLDVALLDVGVPVESIEANYQIDANDNVLSVSDVGMSLFGGAVSVDPFEYALDSPDSATAVHLDGIQLQFMVELAEFDNIELTGSVSGTLPLAMSDEAMTIENGRLDSDPPGGVIRYRTGMSSDQIDDPSSELGLVASALGNFQYDSLSADVDFAANGDLKLQMRLEGVNPDMDPTQPVILNLGIENNLPQMLRSLQATRSITDILEKRVSPKSQ